MACCSSRHAIAAQPAAAEAGSKGVAVDKKGLDLREHAPHQAGTILMVVRVLVQTASRCY